MLPNLLKEKQPYRLRDIFYIGRRKPVAMSYHYDKWVITFHQLLPSSGVPLPNTLSDEVIFSRAP